MKSDLPRLMRERNLDALLIFGPDGMDAANTPFTYFVNEAHVTSGLIIVKQDGSMHLVHHPMERDEAAHTGLNLINRAKYRMPDIIKQYNGDRLKAETELIRRILKDLDVQGRVGFYGVETVNKSFSLLKAIADEEFCQIVTEYEGDVMSQAFKTKDARETVLIRNACVLTELVIGATRDFLRSHRVVQETLIKANGDPLTIGDAKSFIRREMAAQNVYGSDVIFAIGRDAAVPHSSGTLSDRIQLGKTIVFDIFPRGPGGYHADITRTWCLGYAPDDVVQAHEQVLQVHAAMEALFDIEHETWQYQEAACAMFEAMGHPTISNNPGETNGYVHGLGHGFGLAVHESPSMSNQGLRPVEKFLPGMIFCNEPGLYYPDKGWGVRIEDDYWVTLQGKIERLTEFDRSLIVPMQ